MSMSTETKQRFEQEEQAYWQQREELLKQYRGKWVAIVNGQVMGMGEPMNKAAAAAFRKTGSTVMYVNLVGQEDIVFRIRQVASGYYNSTYSCYASVICCHSRETCPRESGERESRHLGNVWSHVIQSGGDSVFKHSMVHQEWIPACAGMTPCVT